MRLSLTVWLGHYINVRRREILVPVSAVTTSIIKGWLCHYINVGRREIYVFQYQ